MRKCGCLYITYYLVEIIKVYIHKHLPTKKSSWVALWVVIGSIYDMFQNCASESFTLLLTEVIPLW